MRLASLDLLIVMSAIEDRLSISAGRTCNTCDGVISGSWSTFFSRLQTPAEL
jgi:hypothetical protein